MYKMMREHITMASFWENRRDSFAIRVSSICILINKSYTLV